MHCTNDYKFASIIVSNHLKTSDTRVFQCRSVIKLIRDNKAAEMQPNNQMRQKIRRRISVKEDILMQIEEKRLEWHGHLRRAIITDWSSLGIRKRRRL